MKYIIIIISIFFLSCEKGGKKNLNQLNNETLKPLEINKIIEDSLLLKAINNSDTLAYKKISNYYLASEKADKLYIYALMMAMEHNYPKAYYDLYECLMFASVYVDQFERDNSKKIAIYYLLKSAELNYKGGKNHLNKYFKNASDIPSSKDYWLKEVESCPR